ncbi:unnamed protein product [Prorocentrum cordatum]|uniref:Uncharacterized protein n=1 Tax=Prorocentrum cordatum TaxID=2364126 RepID=A0ABN9XA38_9DINO|nr:unnamed protein product [Polarella glacialis]
MQAMQEAMQEAAATMSSLVTQGPAGRAPPEAAPPASGAGAGPPAAGGDDGGLELAGEREERTARVAELHARIGREAAAWGVQLEELRVRLQEDISGARGVFEERAARLERELAAERARHDAESQELRAIMDSMWKQVEGRPPPSGDEKQRMFQDSSGNMREFTGDAEDVFTLYDLVREAIGDHSRLSDELAQAPRVSAPLHVPGDGSGRGQKPDKPQEREQREKIAEESRQELPARIRATMDISAAVTLMNDAKFWAWGHAAKYGRVDRALARGSRASAAALAANETFAECMAAESAAAKIVKEQCAGAVLQSHSTRQAAADTAQQTEWAGHCTPCRLPESFCAGRGAEARHWHDQVHLNKCRDIAGAQRQRQVDLLKVDLGKVGDAEKGDQDEPVSWEQRG